MNHMKDALKRRKANGVDVTIVLGGQPEEEKRPGEDSELAPDIKDVTQDQSLMMGPQAKHETPVHEDAVQDKQLIEQMLAQHKDTEDGTNTIAGKARALMRSKLKKG